MKNASHNEINPNRFTLGLTTCRHSMPNKDTHNVIHTLQYSGKNKECDARIFVVETYIIN